MKRSCRHFWSNVRLLHNRLRFRYPIALACYNRRSIRMTHACSTAGGSTPTRPVRWDSSWPAFVLEPQRSAVLGYFDMRFSIPLITFDSFCLLLRHKTYSLLSATPHIERLAGLHVQSVGLPVLRSIRHHYKPTTAVLQHFGTEARRHVLDLSETQIVILLHEREQPLQLNIQPGYVILRHAGHILSCGLYTPGRLRSQLPQHPAVSF